MPTFTRAQAEALLPKVRPLLEDLQRRKQSYDRRPTDPVAKEINALLVEIARLGAEVKDPDKDSSTSVRSAAGARFTSAGCSAKASALATGTTSIQDSRE